jgi:hypothetical protein
MFRKRAIRSFIVLIALAVGSTLAIAHGGMEHVMGTVAALTDASVTVNTVQHKTVTVLIDPSTKFDHNNGIGSLNELKVGDRVVIHAKPNKKKKLVAVTVKWGSGASTAMARPDHMK